MAGRKTDMRQIRRRGNSYQVSVYAGLDPLTRKRLYLTGSSTDLDEARRIRDKLRSQVDDQKHARTKDTIRAAYKEWLENHDVDERTSPNRSS